MINNVISEVRMSKVLKFVTETKENIGNGQKQYYRGTKGRYLQFSVYCRLRMYYIVRLINVLSRNNDTS